MFLSRFDVYVGEWVPVYEGASLANAAKPHLSSLCLAKRSVFADSGENQGSPRVNSYTNLTE